MNCDVSAVFFTRYLDPSLRRSSSSLAGSSTRRFACFAPCSSRCWIQGSYRYILYMIHMCCSVCGRLLSTHPALFASITFILSVRLTTYSTHVYKLKANTSFQSNKYLLNAHMQYVPCFPPFLQTPVRLAFIGTWKSRAMQGSRRSTLKLPLAREGEKAGEMCAPIVATQRTTAPCRVRHCLCAVRCVMRGERDARETRIDREGGPFGTCIGRRVLTTQQKQQHAHTH